MDNQKPYNKKSSKNYLEQASDEIGRQFSEVGVGLSNLERNVIEMLKKKVRESFKNGIEVGRKEKTQGRYRKEKPER